MADMSTYKVEQVSTLLSNIGEAPHWDIETQSLYYTDIYGGTIHRYDFNENKTYTAKIDGEKVISFIIPVDGTSNEFAIGIDRRVGVVVWDGKSKMATMSRIVGEVESEEEYKYNRFNDAKADPTGRLYAGTMRLEKHGSIFEVKTGSLYKYTTENGFEKLLEKIGCSNGLTWNDDTNKFYYIDSSNLDIKEYDYDPKTGNISNERVVISFKNTDNKLPAFCADGMTIDANGDLYVALWAGSEILKIRPESGEIIQKFEFPCEQVTSAAFGGPNLNILFVTTAATDRDKVQSPVAGALFKVTGLDVAGKPMTKAKV